MLTDGSGTFGRSIDIHSPDTVSTGEPMSAKVWSPGRVEDDVRVRSGKLVKMKSDRGTGFGRGKGERRRGRESLETCNLRRLRFLWFP